MECENKEFCRLCLHVIHKNDFHFVDKLAREMLNVLFVHLALDVTENPLMCTSCANQLEKCFDFKLACLCTEDTMVPYVESNSSVNLTEVYLKENANGGINISEDSDICRLCFKLVKGRSFCCYSEIGDEIGFVKDVLEKYFPELHLGSIKDPKVCEDCVVCLKDYLSFVSNCLSVEKKINQFCHVNEHIRQVRLTDVLEFSLEQTVKRKIEVDECDVELDMKLEESVVALKKEIDSGDESLTENGSSCLENGDVNPYIKHEEIDIKPEMSDYESFDTQLSNGDNEEPATGPRVHYLTNNQVSRTRVFKCDVCTYATLIDRNFKAHMLTHRDSSEVPMHKCELCSFNTKHKKSLKRHMLTHKSTSEVRMHSCEICSFQTKLSCDLKRHALTHKSPSEVKMYTCEVCLFETKHKHGLRRHMYTHQSAFEPTVFTCKLCSFTGKFQSDLTQHILTHTSPAEVTMHKCEICGFETKRKHILNQHILVHKSPSEVVMFKCELCAFETKHKRSLKTHMVVHKSPSQLTMFSCEMCSFQTKHKRSLKEHLLTHKSVADALLLVS